MRARCGIGLRGLLPLAAAAAYACGSGGAAPAAAPEPQSTGSGRLELASSLEVDARGDSVWLRLHVTNGAAAPLALEFPTAQRYDFEVRTAAGAEVWRWSADRMFAQVVAREVLAAGETRTYEVVWSAAGAPAGTYEATARLTARAQRIEQRTVFEIE